MSLLRIARLMRLSRMARMARLLRAMPELLIMVKGMITAIKSVFFTLLLLVIVMYVFGMAFVQLSNGTEVGAELFPSVGDAMINLLLTGTFLDNVGVTTKKLMAFNGFVCAGFLVYVFLSALTVTNMLIGVLCEVVNGVSVREKEQIAMDLVREKLQDIVAEADADMNGMISQKEFEHVLRDPKAGPALAAVGVDPLSLVDFADAIFDTDRLEDAEEPCISFDAFMEGVLRLRGDNTAKVKDIVDINKHMSKNTASLNEAIEAMEAKIASMTASLCGDSGPSTHLTPGVEMTPHEERAPPTASELQLPTLLTSRPFGMRRHSDAAKSAKEVFEPMPATDSQLQSKLGKLQDTLTASLAEIAELCDNGSQRPLRFGAELKSQNWTELTSQGFAI